MLIRPVVNTDIPFILKMYADIFKLEVTDFFYKWLYKRNDLFFSFVAEENGEIIGHNAIIENNYIYNGKGLKVGLSSGGMVYPEYSGVFFQILKKQLIDFQVDVMIAFPNSNSERFFQRLFEFDVIKKNYFSITNNNTLILKENFKPLKQLFKRSNEFIKWRLENHPRNEYKKIIKNDCVVYYKEYIKGSIDIIYSTSFDINFYDIITELFGIYNKLNIVHWNKEWIKSLGFKLEENNSFVYKWNDKNENAVKFECQMIDSDVF